MLDAKAIGRRLKAVRIVSGHATLSEFAQKYRIDIKKLHDLEHGVLLLSVSADAEKYMLAVPGMTLDWIYLGNSFALPEPVRQRLQGLLDDMAEPVDNAAQAS